MMHSLCNFMLFMPFYASYRDRFSAVFMQFLIFLQFMFLVPAFHWPADQFLILITTFRSIIGWILLPTIGLMLERLPVKPDCPSWICLMPRISGTQILKEYLSISQLLWIFIPRLFHSHPEYLYDCIIDQIIWISSFSTSPFRILNDFISGISAASETIT